MKSFLKWGLIAVVGLAVLGALLGKDEEAGQTKEGSATTSTSSAPEPTPTETPTPEPTPDPEVSVNYTGPSNVRTDNVVLKGTVDPANAHVRVKGQSVKVRDGHWKLPVTLTTHGENKFRVVATRKGYVKSSTTATIVRELSAAERAVIRQEKAARRANRRALESAESYLAMSGFSKQGLYEQLSSSAGEGFSQAEAQYAVDHVDADWNKEAVESARSYLEMMPMSRNALIEQLSSSAGEGFTYEQALYAVNKVY
jgi:host cell surface-exposed lipoprotein/glucodextranase-like protein